MSRVLTVAATVLSSLAVASGAALGAYAWRNTTYWRSAQRALATAGVREAQATVDGATINYAEGPANGPPLLLVHGQMVDWTTYMRVLPDLARDFQVFAIDCYGHGGSDRQPARYGNVAMGRDQATFLREVIGRPAYVSGNSSGGLLGIQIANEAPDLVRGLILEDPPLFSSLHPRYPDTAGYDLSRLAHAFLESDETDFPTYYIENTSFLDLFGDLAPRLQRTARGQREAWPPRPIHWWYMPPAMNELVRVLDAYDPAFGDTFYTGAWHEGFDHAEALSSLSVPTVLMHANWQLDPAGTTLLGAMDDDEAHRARALIEDVDFRRVDAGHAVHFDKPRIFTDIVRETAARLG